LVEQTIDIGKIAGSIPDPATSHKEAQI